VLWHCQLRSPGLFVQIDTPYGICAVLLMAAFNFFSQGTQDLTRLSRRSSMDLARMRSV
jgi:hypothetical protein